MALFRSLSAALLLAAILGSPALAAGDEAGLDPATKAALQSVITRQLEAFRANDGKAAEAFASPDLQKRFPEPTQFMAMVKENYGALIDPKSTTFTEVFPSPHGPLQKMTVVAKDGSVWTAIYSFEQVDGQWRITACGMERDNSQQDI